MGLLSVGCDDSTSPCSTVKCFNFGLCAEGECQCVGGYEGASCEIPIRDRLIGSRQAEEVCTTVAPHTFTVLISEGQEGISSIVIGNFANRAVNAEAVIQGSGIVIAEQVLQAQNGQVTVEGNGTISDTSLFFHYELEDSSGSFDCNMSVTL